MNDHDFVRELLEAALSGQQYLSEDKDKPTPAEFYEKVIGNFDFVAETERQLQWQKTFNGLWQSPLVHFVEQHKLQPRLSELNNLRQEVAVRHLVLSLKKEREHSNELEISRIRKQHEHELSASNEQLRSVNEQLLETQSKLAKLESSPAKQQQALLVTGYFSFSIVLLCVVYVIYWGMTVSPEISVELNIGELIGGSLVGIGAALAGGAYAIKSLSSQKNRDE
ncbi:hypothetical protein [Methylomonas rosea]|uniref:Uncharacterized protein n=1 Tax=Methylomonas rosea TaxID=2952227 RepID=A0ABT1TW24_9GAMM|nr:hypothetical protein [Methylomonas sp. WSC-7]MCQ8118975.1 hypothetical protein [Methylomonas sp. WSC-7]